MTQPALANRRFPFTGAPVDPLLLCARSNSHVGGELRFRFPCKAVAGCGLAVFVRCEHLARPRPDSSFHLERVFASRHTSATSAGGRDFPERLVLLTPLARRVPMQGRAPEPNTMASLAQ